MQKVSRRAVLTAGISVAGVAAAAAGGYGLVEAGILPGRYRLAQVLGECGAAPPPPHGALPTWEDAVFWSAYRKRMVRMVTLIPAAATAFPAPPVLSSSRAAPSPLPPPASSPPVRSSSRTASSPPVRSSSRTAFSPPVRSSSRTAFSPPAPSAAAPSSPRTSPPAAAALAPRALGVVIALHGLDSGPIGAASLYAPAMTYAGITRFVVIAVDGGNTYWHRRSDGDDPLGMIIHEVLPRAAERGFAVERIGIIGYSMGGYGALLLAERLGAGSTGSVGLTANWVLAGPGPTPAAVAAASPAIFASYQDARAADPGSFDSSSDFARNDVTAGLGGLRDVPAWVTCGSSDPFEPATQLLRSRLARLTGRPPAGGIQEGCHDEAFWARSAPAGLEFIGRHLADG